MLVAFDGNDNRIYADNIVGQKDEKIDLFCPACRKPVILKDGEIRITHFAHKKKGDCTHGSDMSEWHIRMQKYFPKENREVPFVDETTGEVHIADIYDEESGIVIEFQHSPISPEEFRSRTHFHINNGRRIVWIFDESKILKGKYDCHGKLQPKKVTRNDTANNLLLKNIEFICQSLKYINGENEYNFNIQLSYVYREISSIYRNLWFKWLHRRNVLRVDDLPDVINDANAFCICLFTGSEGEKVRKIIAEVNEFELVLLSIHPFIMEEGVKIEEFFLPEEHWIKQLPWVEKIENQRRIKEFESKQMAERIRKARSIRPQWKPMKRNNHL